MVDDTRRSLLEGIEQAPTTARVPWRAANHQTTAPLTTLVVVGPSTLPRDAPMSPKGRPPRATRKGFASVMSPNPGLPASSSPRGHLPAITRLPLAVQGGPHDFQHPRHGRPAPGFRDGHPSPHRSRCHVHRRSLRSTARSVPRRSCSSVCALVRPGGLQATPDAEVTAGFRHRVPRP